jgi:hypothetical protein
MDSLHREAPDEANAFRDAQLEELERYVGAARKAADAKRANMARDYRSVAAYEADAAKRRAAFMRMLGRPLALGEPQAPPEALEMRQVGNDGTDAICRVVLGVADGLSIYGLLFRPARPCAPLPLVVALHGGGGTPELCSSFFGSGNYNDMVRRIRQAFGCVVFAPQLLMWDDAYGPPNRRIQLDTALKQVGSSIAAVEIFKLMRAIDWLADLPETDAARIGAAGLSYGGFYALYAAACDTRIKATLSSCFINDRFAYNWPDLVWKDSGNQFLDAEACGLVCPRALCLEAANRDEVFGIASARLEAKKASVFYEKLGLRSRFVFHEFDGAHEFCSANVGIDFLRAQLEP